MNQFYATKHHQQHAYDKNGKRLLVTVLDAQPVTVTQVKTQDKDGYNALQIGLGQKKKINKPLSGHLKKSELTPRFLREVAVEAEKQVKDTIKVDEVLAVGDAISVHSVSSGKGFAGVMKRWNFAGGPATHGQSDRKRAPGSIGQGTTPGRVWKGKKMAGHMGNVMTAVTGGKVIKIDAENNQIWVKGTVPGKKGSLVGIKKVGPGEFVGLHGESQKEEESQQ